MKHTFRLAALALLGAAATAFAQVPGIIQYQGRVTSNGTNFTGAGQFKFALIETAVTGDSLWSNDGTSVMGSEPTKPASVPVQNGLFIVGLGDSSLANMMTIPASIFSYEKLKLRIWFSDGVGAFAALSPDQPVTSVGFAMMAAGVAPNTIGPAQLLDGAVTGGKIAPDAVAGLNLLNQTITGAKVAANSISSAEVSDTLQLETLVLGGALWDGQLRLNAAGLGEVRGYLTGDGSGSELQLLFANSNTGAVLSAKSTGGQLSLRNSSTGTEGLNLKVSSLGADLTMRNGAADISLLLTGDSNDSGRIQARKPDGTITAEIVGADSASTGGRMTLRRAEGTSSVVVDAENGTSGGARVALTTGGGITTVELLAAETAGTGSELRLGNGNGINTVVIDADNDGEGNPRVDFFKGDNTSTMAIAPGGTDVTLGGGGLIRLGEIAGNNLGIDGDEIIARTNGAAAPLRLNYGYTAPVVMSRLAIGTLTPATGYELSVNGQIICEELVVQNSNDWPDYVFADDYPLMPLEEVEANIKRNKHLPGIPSARKIGADGIPLGEIQRQMMEKIEELTLHLIRQNKRLAAQEEELARLRSHLNAAK